VNKALAIFILSCAAWIFNLQAVTPLSPLQVEGVVVDVTGGRAFRFTSLGEDLFAVEDPKGLLGPSGRRIRIRGELTRESLNSLPVVNILEVGLVLEQDLRQGPLMQPAGPGTSAAFFKAELAYAARVLNSGASGGGGGGTATDTDGDGTPDDLDSDDDNDEMPDTYELAQGLNSKVNDALLDKDGDGMLNIDEFRAGFAAGDASSVFKVLGIQITPSQICFRFSSIPGRQYRIMNAPQPGGTPSVLQTGIAADPVEPFTQICFNPSGITGIFFIQQQ